MTPTHPNEATENESTIRGEPTCEAMVLSVGGTPDPVIFSLANTRPRRALFVVSQLSKPEVEAKILPAIGYPLPADYCLLSKENHLESIYQDIRDRISDWAKTSQIDPAKIRVDLTGGTKVMSAGLALAAMEFCSDFHYVSGGKRTKDGKGTVESGTEYVISSSNPWNVRASKERERAAWLYSVGQPGEAADGLEAAAERCTPTLRTTLKGYVSLLRALDTADRFAFASLAHTMNRHREVHELVLARNEEPAAYSALEVLRNHWRALEDELKQGQSTTHTFREMLCNANRRASQRKWDDAVARLYRATELWVQGIAWEAFDAPFGRLPLSNIAEARREEFVARFGLPDESEIYKLALMRLVEAVADFSDHPRRTQTKLAYEQLAGHLAKRNESILAHGNRPASQSDYEHMRKVLLDAVGLKESELPTWPKLTFGV